MISMKGITKTYSNGFTALHSVSLDICEGMFGLLGPNGAGKTTLMRLIAGLLDPTDGQMTILGQDIASVSGKMAVKRALGYLPQDIGLYPDLTARQFLDYIAILKGLGDRKIRHRQIDQLLALVRLTEVSNRPLKTFSGGMKRRAGIAQALLGDPKLLIVDEPTVGLDPEERVRFRMILTELAAHCTVILSTHIIEDISQSCSDLAIIQKGQVLFHGVPNHLIQAVRGKVWIIRMPGELSDPDLYITSAVQLQDCIQYRVLGSPTAKYAALPAEPSLEDGYIWAMQRAKLAQETLIVPESQ